METPKIVVFVVKRYAVREAKKWRYAVRNAKIERYAVRKGGGGCHPHQWIVPQLFKLLPMRYIFFDLVIRFITNR